MNSLYVFIYVINVKCCESYAVEAQPWHRQPCGGGRDSDDLSSALLEVGNCKVSTINHSPKVYVLHQISVNIVEPRHNLGEWSEILRLLLTIMGAALSWLSYSSKRLMLETPALFTRWSTVEVHSREFIPKVNTIILFKKWYQSLCHAVPCRCQVIWKSCC